MKGLKNFIALASLLICVSACSYKPKVAGVDTSFAVSIYDIKGTQVAVEVRPDIDMCWYVCGVISVADFEEDLRKIGSEDAAMKNVIDSLYVKYEDVTAGFAKRGDKYICGFEDLGFYFGNYHFHYIDLQPETDYFFIVFCVDPSKCVSSGRLQRFPFKTTAISPVSSKMELTFMVHDGDDFLYYYTKPTLDGALCREHYLVDIVSDEVLENYGGDINAYAAGWYADKLALGLIPYYLKDDISRSKCLIDKTKAGAGYTIMGAPYNIYNIDKLFTLHFNYVPGIIIDKYTNDQKAQ